jgi:hypothetical protein
MGCTRDPSQGLFAQYSRHHHYDDDDRIIPIQKLWYCDFNRNSHSKEWHIPPWETHQGSLPLYSYSYELCQYEYYSRQWLNCHPLPYIKNLGHPTTCWNETWHVLLQSKREEKKSQQHKKLYGMIPTERKKKVSEVVV